MSHRTRVDLIQNMASQIIGRMAHFFGVRVNVTRELEFLDHLIECLDSLGESRAITPVPVLCQVAHDPL